MKKIYTFLLLISIFITSFGQIPAGYYDNAQGKTGDELKAALYNIIKGHHEFSYSEVWDQLKYTDEDPNNSNNVILIYTGWSYPKTDKGGETTEWNREHVWAKSHGDFGTANGPGTDLHHLRPADVTVNSARGNLYFDNGGSEYSDNSRYGQSGTFDTGCKKDDDSWEPRDEVKGDVARMIFYMATRYEGENNEPDLEVVDYIPSNSSAPLFAKLSTLLQWNEQDPVSDWEIRRNNRVYERQHNRNPYIDHPEYVNRVFDPANAIDRTDEIHFTVSPNPVSNWFYVKTNDSEQKHVFIYNTQGKLLKSFDFNSTEYKIDASDLNSGVLLIKIIEDKSVALTKIIKN